MDRTSVILTLNLIVGIAFCVLPVKWFLFKILKLENDNGEEGEYQDCMNNLKHYDVQNPITQSAGNSRIKGRTLKDGIIRGILKTLKGKAQVIGNVDIEDPTTNSLGLNGFRDLVRLQKKKDKEDIAYNPIGTDQRKSRKLLLNKLMTKGQGFLGDNSQHFSDEMRDEEEYDEEEQSQEYGSEEDS